MYSWWHKLAYYSLYNIAIWCNKRARKTSTKIYFNNIIIKIILDSYSMVTKWVNYSLELGHISIKLRWYFLFSFSFLCKINTFSVLSRTPWCIWKPNMKACLTCVCAQRASCPICSRALHSLCPMHSRALRASSRTCSCVLLVSCFASSVPRMRCVLFALVLHVPLNIGTYVSHVPCALCTLALYESFFLRSASVSYLVLYV